MTIYRERKGPQGNKCNPDIAPGSRRARGRLADTGGRNAELAETAPTFLPPRPAWSASTKRSYVEYGASPAARALRPDDLWGVRQLFDYIDRLDIAWAKVPDAPTPAARQTLNVVRVLQDLVSRRSKEYGLGPSARKALGIPDAPPHVSKLDQYRRGGPGAGVDLFPR